MKKIMIAAALAATFGINTAVMAESPVTGTGSTSDYRTIVLEVEKVPNVLLSGSLFEQPTMPTLESLEYGQPTMLGEMRITSSAGMCHVSVTTEHDFTLMDPTIGMELSKYSLDYQNTTGPMTFDSNSQGMMSLDCMSQANGMMSLVPHGYNPEAPAGIYSDVVNVLVEVAG